MEYPWCRTAQQVAADYGVDPDAGLSSDEVLARRSKHGSNELEKEQATPLWKLVLEQFDDMLVKVSRGLPSSGRPAYFAPWIAQARGGWRPIGSHGRPAAACRAPHMASARSR